jgi:hypothetical protein
MSVPRKYFKPSFTAPRLGGRRPPAHPTFVLKTDALLSENRHLRGADWRDSKSEGGCPELGGRIHLDIDTDAETALIERRWFASMKAVRKMQAECEVLREVMELAESSWRLARSRLSSLEAAHDTLGEELAQRDACRAPEAALRSVA